MKNIFKSNLSIASKRNILFVFFFFIYTFSNSCFAGDPELSIQTGHTYKIKQLNFTKDGKILGSLSEDNAILLWDTKTGRQIKRIDQQTKILGFTFHSQNKYITLLVSSGEQITIDYYHDSVVSKKYLNDSLVKIMHNEKKNEFIVADHGGFSIYDSKFNTILHHYKAPNDLVIKDAYLSSGGEMIFVLLKETKKFVNFMQLKYLNTTDLSEIISKSIYSRKSSIDENASVAFSDDQKLFISQYQFLDQVKILGDNLERETKYAVSEKYFNEISSLCAVNSEIYAGLVNGDIQIYNSKDKKYVDVLKGHSNKITAMAFHPTSKYVVSGDANGLIILWDVNTKQLIHALEGNAEQITTFVFNHDKSKIVIGYLNGDLKFWDRLTQETRKINLQTFAKKAKMGFGYIITDIDSLLNDSTIQFDCTSAFSLNKNAFDHLIYYTGKWNFLTNQIELTEIGTEFQLVVYINSPYNFYQISYQNKFINPHLTDSTNGINVSAIGNTIFIQSEKITTTIFTSHQSGISKIKIIGKRIYSSGWDGAIKEFDLETQKEIMTFGIMGRSGFFYYLPEGNYYTAKSALKFLSFRLGDKVFPFDQFDMLYNRPDIVLDSLPFIEEDIINQFHKAYEKRVNRSVKSSIDENTINEIPVIEVVVPSLIVKDGNVNITVTATDQNSEITNIHVLVNGVQEKKSVFVSDKKIIQNFSINLNYEMNNIVVYAENSDGLLSLKEEYNILNTQRIRKPDLYLITIGSGKFIEKDFDLNFAAKDAGDIKSSFPSKRNFNEIHSLHFENENVKKEILYEISDFINKANENDQIVLFYAGHGVLDKNYDYYLSTFDIQFTSPSTRGISYLDLEEILNHSNARQKLLMIDACHSGEIDKDAVKEVKNTTESFKGKIKFRGTKQSTLLASGALELSKVIFTNTENKNGTAIISSSGGGELAIEGDEWNNGLFTYALLNGMKKNNADENNDGNIVISELQNYVNKTVVKISGGYQTPNARSENLLNDFIIKK